MKIDITYHEMAMLREGNSILDRIDSIKILGGSTIDIATSDILTARLEKLQREFFWSFVARVEKSK